MEHMRLDVELLNALATMYHNGSVIAAICSGAQLLISAKLVRERRISGYYSIRDDIENAGATFVDAPAVVDARIVTSPHYKFLGHWMKAVLETAQASRFQGGPYA
jgi:protease I